MAKELATQTISERALAGIQVGNKKFKVAKQVTRPLLQTVDGKQLIIKIDGPMGRSEQTRAAKKLADGSEDTDKLPPYIMPVTDLETGKLHILVCGVQLVDQLQSAYPERTDKATGEVTSGYVGKSFAILSQKHAMPGKGGKMLRHYEILEIEAE